MALEDSMIDSLIADPDVTSAIDVLVTSTHADGVAVTARDCAE
ncbi:hypothetical protein ACFOJ6_10265 [Gordonia humi]|uniref:Uncharacterized protein n=1 Tax=Gordonia humi TaxID=686429 RepID=A0A840EYN8_9ACTN|nr:hypothetical protein [Gordonia humi]